MIILMNVVPAFSKSIINQLIEIDGDFEYNTFRDAFRIHNVTQWMFLENKGSYLISTKNTSIEIHKDNIVNLCISDK